MDEVTSTIINFANGRIAVNYHNGMSPLRIRYTDKFGKAKTVEQYIADIENYLMDDEHIEVGETSVDVFKTYGLKESE